VSEENLSRLSSQNQKTKKDLKRQAQQLNELQSKQEENEKKLVAQQKEMSQQIRAAYMSGNNEFLKILLSQQSMADIQKNMAYYRYFLKERVNLIEGLRETMLEIEKNSQQIEKKSDALIQLQSKQQSEINHIQDAQQQRNQVLVKLEETISSKSERLNILEQNRKALESVVSNLKVKATTRPEQHQPYHGAFSKGKGKMRWPVNGKITAGFDSKIEGSQLKQNGVIISSPKGENIQVVSSGRVVFSQWMAGYGLLVIVDHGDGYMTLYGRNDVVYRKVGDEVSAGDVLATVGSSGGFSMPALYFAVRKDGKPLNPAEWCTG
jgi:septal ring factor EnvC (AmiA/AmiB activator)